MFQRHLLRTALAIVLSLAGLSAARAATPTLDELLSLKSASRPRISPDGRLVAYEVTETDWKDNAYVTHTWLADRESGRSFQLTRGKKSSNGGEWSPDGRWLAFFTERESGTLASKAAAKKEGGGKEPEGTPEAKPEERQIWLISPAGGEAWMLTKHGAHIDSFRWSPDGKRLAFTAAAPEPKAMKERKEKYSDYEVVEHDFQQNELWVVDVAEAAKGEGPVEASAVAADPKLNVEGFDWSPDGASIAFAASSDPLLAHGDSSDLYVVSITGGEKGDHSIKKIVALPGPDSNPRFSPDGSELAFNTSLGETYHFYTNDHIASVRLDDVRKRPATSRGDVTDLTASFDEDAGLMEWGGDGIYFRAAQKTSTHLFRLDPRTKTVARVTAPDAFYLNDASLTADHRSVAFTAGAAHGMPEVFVASLSAAGGNGFTPKKLTDMSAQLAGYTLGSMEVVQWKSQDGETIEGVLHKPADFDPAKKYPLLLVIHGGPTGVSRPVWAPARTYPIEQFLAKGALVLEPNYRGSAGYDGRFRALNVRNLGVGDMWDVMSGVDAMIARGFVDPARLGSMGWSQGGYISAFLTTNTDRFKAISAGAGISDWSTYYVATDITPFTPQYLHATPWDDPEIYAKTSPITNIRKAKTPTLIQCGEKDRRVPPANSYELYRGLRDQGVDARLMVYAGFGHGITKPKSNRAVLQHNLDWFCHYLWNEPIPNESPLNGSGPARPAA
jgi:dipeptidyl aminopeptidase/acylaminoacyl peptidase